MFKLMGCSLFPSSRNLNVCRIWLLCECNISFSFIPFFSCSVPLSEEHPDFSESLSWQVWPAQQRAVWPLWPLWRPGLRQGESFNLWTPERVWCRLLQCCDTVFLLSYPHWLKWHKTRLTLPIISTWPPFYFALWLFGLMAISCSICVLNANDPIEYK